MLDLVMSGAYSNRVTGFTKLFSTIIHSTVWREAMHVKVVWVTMLAMADRNGRVNSSLPGLADAARVTIEQCEEALEKLLGPDPYSRSKEHEGRRVKNIDGGWELLNYLKYREQRDSDERRLQVREAVSRHRAKKADVIQGKPRKPKKAQAEAEDRSRSNTDNGALSPSPSQASVTATDLEPCSSEKGKREPVPNEQREEYAEAVRQAFAARLGRSTYQFTSADYYWLKKWMDEGVRLSVALVGINETRNVGEKLAFYNSSVMVEHERVSLALSGTR